ncbi:MAG: hypothetical protein IJS52_00210, partial [Bacilli bacterium]|nr:hypothetical protein [Bacilli bacterium]
MKAKHIHLALASLVLASCGGSSSPSSSPASIASSEAPTVSSDAAPSSEAAPNSSSTIPAHDKAKTIENILAATTYRLDNFTHIETENSAEPNSSASSFKVTSIIDNHNYFEAHNYDCVYWEETSAASRMKLSEYLAQAHMTLEQFKAMLPRMEAAGIKFTIDEENDLLQMSMGSLALDTSKIYVFYDTGAKQHEQYVYTLSEEEGETCTAAAYLLDGEAGLLDVPTAVNELTLFALDQGTFNPAECSYTIEDLSKAELSPVLQEGIASIAKSLTLTIKDDYPEKLLLDVDLEALGEMMGASENANIIASEYGVAFDYKGPFLDLSGKRAGVDCSYQHHGHAQYEYLEDGYRAYCANCNKYLGEKQSYAFDSTYHVCAKSGRIDGLNPHADKTYAGLIYVDEQEGVEYYAFSYANNEKYGTKWDAYTFEAKRINESADENMEIYSHYEEGVYYNYWPEQKALVVEKGIGSDPIANSCQLVFKKSYSFYKDVEINYESSEWTLSNGTALADALESMTPAESIEALSLSEYHEHVHDVTYKGEDCDVLHVEVCDDCGEEVHAYFRSTNHSFEYGEVLSYADLSAFLEGMEAYNRWEEEDTTLIVKATCTKCEDTIIFVITPEYSQNGNYWIGSIDEWGDFSFTLTNDPLPGLKDAEGQQIFPIV